MFPACLARSACASLRICRHGMKPLLTRFDSRITQTGPTHISTTPQKGSAPSSYFFHLEKQAQVPGPHPGDHSHRPPPGWVGGNNKHTLQVSMHTSSTNLAAAISTSSTGTITSILHKRDLSIQQLPCPRNINTLHPRTRPLREKGCLCPSPTKPKTTTPLLTRFDSRIALTGPTHISTTPQKGSASSSYFFSSGETGTGARPTPRGSQSSTAPNFSLGSPNSNRKQQPNKHHETKHNNQALIPIP